MARRCPICRSRQWHKEAASGLVTCSEGHVLQNYRNETTERTEFGPHALRKRTLKSGRVKKDDMGRGDEALYHGTRARYLYFESLQLILRAQVHVLIEEWKLPEEFEVICKDIWALHLSLLRHPPDPEWIANDDGGAGGSGSGSDSDGWTEGSNEDEDESENDNKEEAAEEKTKDTIVDELLHEAEGLPSGSEGGGSDEGREATRKGRTTVPCGRKRNIYEAPAGNIAVLVMGCWTMRLPVMYRDFVRLIEGYKLPYLDGVRVLPGEMRRHLAKETVGMLSPRFAPTVLGLHRLSSRLARLCWTRYGIHTPEVNGAPMLWRCVQALRGTATLYGLAKAMARELSLPLTLGAPLGPELGQGGGHKGDNVPAEVGLAGVVVVVLKMVYGLDGAKRRGVADGDPVWALPGLERYIRLVGEEEEEAGLFVECGKMLDGDIDRYLAFCARALLGDGEKTVDEYFPMGDERGDDEQGNDGRGDGESEYFPLRRRLSYSEIAKLPAVETGRVKIYRAGDRLGTVPAAFSVVLEAAARFAAVSVEQLAAFVEKLERRCASIT